jgi:hypothetical protein
MQPPSPQAVSQGPWTCGRVAECLAYGRRHSARVQRSRSRRGLAVTAHARTDSRHNMDLSRFL